MMEKERVNICMATASDYQYVVVAVTSLLMNSSDCSDITFHFFVSDDFDQDGERCLTELCSEYGCGIRFYRVGKMFTNAKSHLPWISTPTYYRLIIPDLLADQTKCLYLDADIVVLGDIMELYTIDISNELVAGVYALAYQKFTDKETYINEVKIKSLDHYVNAGVLLMNLEKMRNVGFVNKAMNLIGMNLPSQDQDIINKICYDGIKIIPFRYNAMTKYYYWHDTEYEPFYDREEISEAWSRPIIVHYADGTKPWNYFRVPLAAFWWYYCKKTCLWNYWRNKTEGEFIYRSMFYIANEEHGNIERTIFSRIKKSSGVLIFGAGDNAKRIIYFLSQLGINIVSLIVTSLVNNPIMVEEHQVIQIDRVAEKNKKLPVIIAAKDEFNAEIVKSLWENGFDNIVIYKNGNLI